MHPNAGPSRSGTSASLTNRFATLRADGDPDHEGDMSDDSTGNEVRSLRDVLNATKKAARAPVPEIQPADEGDNPADGARTYAEAVANEPEHGQEPPKVMQLPGYETTHMEIKMYGKSEKLDDKTARYTLAYEQAPGFLDEKFGKYCDEVSTVDYLRENSSANHEYTFMFHLIPCFNLTKRFEDFRISIFRVLSEINCTAVFFVLGTEIQMTVTVPLPDFPCTFYSVSARALNFRQIYHNALALIHKAYADGTRPDTRLAVYLLRVTANSPYYQLVLPALASDPNGLLHSSRLVGQSGNGSVQVFAQNRICDTCSGPVHKNGVCPRTSGLIVCAACKIGRFTPEVFRFHRTCRTHKFSCMILDRLEAPIPQDHTWVEPPLTQGLGPRPAQQGAGSPFPPSKRGRRW